MRTRDRRRRLTGSRPRLGRVLRRRAPQPGAHQVADLLGLGDLQRQRRAAVDDDSRRRGRRRPRRSAPAASGRGRVEHPPHDVADDRSAGSTRRGSAPIAARRVVALQAPAELAAQVVRLAGGHRGARHRRRHDDAADPERADERERDDEVDDERRGAQAGRQPRPLQREERPRQQEVDAGERQAEGEPEQRLGGDVRRARCRTAALVDDA